MPPGPPANINYGTKSDHSRDANAYHLSEQEIEKTIRRVFSDILTDSVFEIKELLRAFVNSGKVVDEETLRSAIDYVKPDILDYFSKLNNPTNGSGRVKSGDLAKIIEQKLLTFSEPQQDTGSFCCKTGGSIKKKHKRKAAKKTKGKTKRKWSKKYKDSINCKKPKGFSQRQHCLAKSKKRKIAKKN